MLDDDGWLHTGDLGEIDDEGFVRVTGRKQELLVTLGGKNVEPTVLEDAVRAHPLVSQCMVVGDGRPFVAALVTLDADRHGRLGGDRRTSSATLRCGEPAAVAAHGRPSAAPRRGPGGRRRRQPGGVAGRVDPAVRPACVGDWTEAGGQLTPSLKLRRGVIVDQRAAEAIEALYAR